VKSCQHVRIEAEPGDRPTLLSLCTHIRWCN
jgi:hypothetical protein